MPGIPAPRGDIRAIPGPPAGATGELVPLAATMLVPTALVPAAFVPLIAARLVIALVPGDAARVIAFDDGVV